MAKSISERRVNHWIRTLVSYCEKEYLKDSEYLEIEIGKSRNLQRSPRLSKDYIRKMVIIGEHIIKKLYA